MNFRNTTRSWGAVSKALHWLIVILIIMQWVIMQRAEALPMGSDKIFAIVMHKSFGMTVFALAIIRLVWRWANPVPTLDGMAKNWERMLAGLSHLLLYALIFAMPLTGWLMSSARNFPVSWFGLFTFPDLVAPDKALYERMVSLHHALFTALLVVATLHVVGALKHQLIDKNEVLRRMLPFGGVK
jgi:cytochrome b561